MFNVHHELARLLMDERLARAEQARVLKAARRQAAENRRKVVEASQDAEIFELTFGSVCQSDQIGA
jgi:hypothetical protein